MATLLNYWRQIKQKGVSPFYVKIFALQALQPVYTHALYFSHKLFTVVHWGLAGSAHFTVDIKRTFRTQNFL